MKENDIDKYKPVEGEHEAQVKLPKIKQNM